MAAGPLESVTPHPEHPQMLHWFVYAFWEPKCMILEPFWDPCGIIFPWFVRSKNALLFGSILGCLLEGFWDAWPSKVELSRTRNTNFDKVSFFVPEAFFDAKWTPKDSQNGAKKPLKIDQKSDPFFNQTKYRFFIEIRAQRDPKRDPKIEWSQNGAKMEPKWT